MPVVTAEALLWQPLRRRVWGAGKDEPPSRAKAWAGWLLTNAVLLPFAPLFVEPLRVAGVFDDMLEAFPTIRL